MIHKAKTLTRTQKNLIQDMNKVENQSKAKIAKINSVKLELAKRTKEQIKADNEAALKRIFG